MRNATSSGKCKTLCNSSSSPGNVGAIAVATLPAPMAAVPPTNGCLDDNETTANKYH